MGRVILFLQAGIAGSAEFLGADRGMLVRYANM